MKKKGFTLIELIIVISIVSLLASIALIKLNVVDRIKEKNEVNTLMADINYCKEKARVTGIDYSFHFKEKNYLVKRAYASNYGDSENNESTSIKNVDMDLLEFKTADKITFKASGSVAGANSFTIKGLINDYELVIGVAGANARIEKK